MVFLKGFLKFLRFLEVVLVKVCGLCLVNLRKCLRFWILMVWVFERFICFVFRVENIFNLWCVCVIVMFRCCLLLVWFIGLKFIEMLLVRFGLKVMEKYMMLCLLFWMFFRFFMNNGFSLDLVKYGFNFGFLCCFLLSRFLMSFCCLVLNVMMLMVNFEVWNFGDFRCFIILVISVFVFVWFVWVLFFV